MLEPTDTVIEQVLDALKAGNLMPTIVMTKWPSKVDGSVRAKAMDFLQKLATDDTTLGLHVEPIRHCADPRVRTGRVDLYWRAVMFRLDDGGERHYVIHGVFQHDRAEEIARRITLTVNPVNGFPQITEVASRPARPWSRRRSRAVEPAERCRACPTPADPAGADRETIGGRPGHPAGRGDRSVGRPRRGRTARPGRDSTRAGSA